MTLIFHKSDDDKDSYAIIRHGNMVGHIRTRRYSHRNSISFDDNFEFNVDDLEQCIAQLKRLVVQDEELGKEVVCDTRSARIDMKRVDGEGEYAVFQRTYYMGRWYYDGYASFNDLSYAIRFRDAWLSGSNPAPNDYRPKI